jgi:hypothetical protein
VSGPEGVATNKERLIPPEPVREADNDADGRFFSSLLVPGALLDAAEHLFQLVGQSQP